MNRLSSIFLLSFLGLLFFSCDNDQTKKDARSTCKDCVTEEAFPDKTGTPETMTVGGQTLHYTAINGKAVFEGDIILDSSFVAFNDTVSLVGAGINGRRWPNNTLVYTIDPGLADSQKVIAAMQHWQSNTPIRFKRKGTKDRNWVTFYRGDGCSSVIGMSTRQQFISLAPGCSIGNAIHEIGHALGLFHENSRSDRDSFLVIKWDNIKEGYKHNFETYLERGYSGFDDGSFDFNSRMLYNPFSFAKDPNQPTITRKDGSVYPVNWNTLSEGDQQIINRMYPPTGSTATVQ